MRLEAKNISFSYLDKKPVLSDIDFTVETGEIVGLTAPSGYGKSTLGKILAGYLKPDKGTVLLDGQSVDDKAFHPVQLIFQHPEKAVNPRWKMKKILTEAWVPPEEMIRKMGIEQGWMNRWPAELSGGELQRFCVLRALSPQTKFLIADEMTTMLDAINQAHIWNFVLSYAEKHNITLLAITHNRYLADQVATRVLRIPELNHIQVDRSEL